MSSSSCGLLLALLVVACNKSEAATEAPSTTPPAEAAVAAAPIVTAPRNAPTQLCDSLCAPTQALRCGHTPEECRSNCQQMLTVPQCSAQMLDALGCMAAQPLSAWECGAEGAAAVKDGVCETQQAAVARCLAS